MLDGADLEFRIALEDAAEDHVAERHPHPVVGVGQEGIAGAVAVLKCKILPGARPVGRDVHAERNIEILGRRPQRLVHGTVVALPLRRIDGDHAAASPILTQRCSSISRAAPFGYAECAPKGGGCRRLAQSPPHGEQPDRLSGQNRKPTSTDMGFRLAPQADPSGGIAPSADDPTRTLPPQTVRSAGGMRSLGVQSLWV